ncbi:ScyD/ScyE family protein [Kitasatospora sp. LaBMicrA B282]|uniref:ScyD/ScyE family protein n=1 Tax=Kitasatospora sp. LaBMicrA B282 TaxID=3420949 RepID=UPI003D150908
MSSSRRSWKGALLVAVAVAGVLAAEVPAQASTSTPSLSVIAQNLQNPRKITVLHDGSLLVAEAGQGQPGCATGTCAALTGAVYKVSSDGWQGTVASNLPSSAAVPSPAGSPVEAAGPIQAYPDGFGGYTVLTGYDGTDTSRAALGPNGAQLGTILDTATGTTIADLVHYETVNNPDGQGPESNPYGFVRDGNGGFVAIDAAGNDVVNVDWAGNISTNTVMPEEQTSTGLAQSVPTAVIKGTDGSYYVSDMGGMRPNAGRIWRLVPGQAPQLVASGLTNLIDLAQAPDGNLYALSLTSGFGATGPAPGALYEVNTSTGTSTEIPTGGLLSMPTGLAVGPQGQIYIANHGVGVGAGQLVQLNQ